MKHKGSFKQHKGITLVALVVTIIVLIILAGISISLLFQDNGIITKAKQGAENFQIAANEESSMLANVESIIDAGITGGNSGGEPTKNTLVSQITAANYGDKVNYSVTVNGVILGNGTNGELDWWKIFYKDPNTNEVIMMYGDYLPNSTNLATEAGLVQGTGNYATYGVRSNTDRTDLINKLNNTNNWSKLIRNDLTGKAIAKGTVDLETWVASWNAKGYQTLYTAKETGMSDSIGWGYYVGTSENPTSYNQRVDSNAGYNDTLYFPYKTDKSSCWGYWLASPSVASTAHVMSVDYDGSVYGNYYDCSLYGVCPAVYLTSNILTSGKDASGNWIIE